MHRLDTTREHALGLFRIVIGFLFACHGVKTLFGLFGAAAPVPVGQWPGWWAALIQLAAGTLVCLGVGTRVAALLGSGSMAYAYFAVHSPHGLLPIENGGEASAMFCWALLILAFTGPGRFSLATALRPKTRAATRQS
ncbi:DoxX family protein [Amycolatopsis panacis]|uniref:DoxX family protein n=1 Tax=Amycolatopsis panacis TaxID=2340917 RepID=A0A419HQY0_9PSEU|nr:DoxX family protein [Amycolatopsis panacis]RJQ78900.1 DoxX family protein [Amycolatopsis panacis]